MAALYAYVVGVVALMVVTSPFYAQGQAAQPGWAGQELANRISNYPGLSLFYDSLQSSRILGRLINDVNTMPVTVFAPTDAAFEKDPVLLRCLTSGQGVLDILTQVLLFHIADGKAYTLEQLKNVTTYSAASGLPVPVTVDPTTHKIIIGEYLIGNSATVIVGDAISSVNATVHIIDTVLIPETSVDNIDRLCYSPASIASPVMGL